MSAARRTGTSREGTYQYREDVRGGPLIVLYLGATLWVALPEFVERVAPGANGLLAVRGGSGRHGSEGQAKQEREYSRKCEKRGATRLRRPPHLLCPPFASTFARPYDPESTRRTLRAPRASFYLTYTDLATGAIRANSIVFLWRCSSHNGPSQADSLGGADNADWSVE